VLRGLEAQLSARRVGRESDVSALSCKEMGASICEMEVTCLHCCRGEYKLKQLLDKLQTGFTVSENVFLLRPNTSYYCEVGERCGEANWYIAPRHSSVGILRL